MAVPIPEWYAKKPVAAVADIGTHGRWIDIRLTAADIAAFNAAVGSDRPGRLPPIGLVPMLARFAYLNGHRAPAGGVLARLRWTNHSSFPADGMIKARSGVIGDFEKRGRRRVEIEVVLAQANETPIATVVWEIVWPDGAA